MDNSYEQQAIDLVKQNEVLKAQVNAFRDGVRVFNRSGGNLNPLLTAYLETPEQCLNSVKASAAIELAGIFHDGEWRSDTAMLICEGYANKLRANN